MAFSHEAWLKSSGVLWILLIVLAKTTCKKTQIFAMEGSNCEDGKLLGGAVVYSHLNRANKVYGDNIECRTTFKAERNDWRIMLRVVDLDIPDISYNQLCNDALYVYDGDTILGRAMKLAGGNGGLCGDSLPPVIYSSGPFLTIYFRSDASGPKGKGFKLILTAYSEDFEKYGSCGTRFKCANNKCVDMDLLCDTIDHCGDFSDESPFGGAQCGKIDKTSRADNTTASRKEEGILSKFLSLGVTAAISITVGSVVVFVVCIVCTICCCCRCMRKRTHESGSAPTTTTATSVTINNGGPPIGALQHEQYAIHNGGGPMTMNMNVAMAPDGRLSTSLQQVPYLQGPTPYHQAYAHHGYYPMQQVQQVHPGHQHQHHHPPPAPHSVTYSPYPQRESYSQGSMYSSQPPPSYHRSYTPTSSRSDRSRKSSESAIKYTHPHSLVGEKV